MLHEWKICNEFFCLYLVFKIYLNILYDRVWCRCSDKNLLYSIIHNHAIKRQILTTANVFLMWNNISVAFITSKNERSTGILDHNLKYPVTKSKGLGIPLITIQEFKAYTRLCIKICLFFLILKTKWIYTQHTYAMVVKNKINLDRVVNSV